EACRILIDADGPDSPRWSALATLATELMDQRLPPELLARRMRIPEAFRCQDLTHVDLYTFAERFAASGRDPRRDVLVVGPRTAGAYFAPLISAYLTDLGWRRTSWVSIRPKAGVCGRERRRIRALAAGGAHVILVDDYPESGKTFQLMVELLVGAGVSAERLTLLVPRHPARADWGPDREEWATGTAVITLDAADLHKRRLLDPQSAEAALREFHPDAADLRILDHTDVDAINERLSEHYGDGFEVRLKCMYEVELVGGPGVRIRRVLAKSVGWGWLGYHGYIIGSRLAGEVPAVIGLRQGLLFSEWLDAGGPGLADASL